ncbi:L-ribulose-5-phosphate 3-epimerase [[Mycoplasma] cavipharyngis]|uniref:L-ribulose-5-phosphate 3-epimerase n=1 Tax=[Mycoplasma] cavipharyngis TaxID=92757 RepID=UPI0037046C39
MILTKLGLYEKALHDDLTLEQKVLLAKTAKFDFLELSIDESIQRLKRLEWDDQKWLKLKKFLDQNNFYFNSLCLSAHRKYPLGSTDATIRQKSLTIFQQALHICQLLDIKIIQLAGYDVYYETSSAQTKALFAENLKIITSLAASANIQLGIETMDTPFLGTATKVRYYVDLINSPYLQIYPDLGNLFQWTNDPENDLINNIDHFLQVHIKATLPNVFRDLAWEQSNVPFIKLLSILAKNGYQKNFLVEMWAPKNQIFDYQKELERLNYAYQFVSDKLIQSGYQLCLKT